MLIDGPIAEPLTSNAITDWVQGDSRVFLRTIADNLLDAGDTITDAFLTIKASPAQQDQYALLRIHVVQLSSPYGSVGLPVGGVQLITISVPGNLVSTATPTQPNVPYSYEIKFFTANGEVWSPENGTIQFVPQVGDMEVGGTPFPITQGHPSFRGYAVGPPPPASSTLYYTGDWIRNSNPTSGSPSGWVCVMGGVPGAWVDYDNVGDSPGIVSTPSPSVGMPSYRGFATSESTVNDSTPVQGDWARNLLPQPGRPSGFVFTGSVWVSDGNIADDLSVPPAGADPVLGPPPTMWGFAYGPPVSGAYGLADWVRNILPIPGSPSGWVCTTAGSPGIWMSDGFVGLD